MTLPQSRIPSTRSGASVRATRSSASASSATPSGATTRSGRPPLGSNSSTKKIKTSTKKSSPKKKVVYNARPGNARPGNANARKRTPTMAVCKRIRAAVLTRKHQKTVTVLGKQVKLAPYRDSKEAHFGLELDYCVLFHDAPTLPDDHPKHNEFLESFAVSRRPPQEYLLDPYYTTAQLAIDLRKEMCRCPWDVGTDAWNSIDFSQIITSLRQQARDAEPASLKQSSIVDTTKPSKVDSMFTKLLRHNTKSSHMSQQSSTDDTKKPSVQHNTEPSRHLEAHTSQSSTDDTKKPPEPPSHFEAHMSQLAGAVTSLAENQIDAQRANQASQIDAQQRMQQYEQNQQQYEQNRLELQGYLGGFAKNQREIQSTLSGVTSTISGLAETQRENSAQISELAETQRENSAQISGLAETQRENSAQISELAENQQQMQATQ
ncbi:MAG: hypothetical protein SGARI_000791, partial [Bacillariaceae sp.]